MTMHEVCRSNIRASVAVDAVHRQDRVLVDEIQLKRSTDMSRAGAQSADFAIRLVAKGPPDLRYVSFTHI